MKVLTFQSPGWLPWQPAPTPQSHLLSINSGRLEPGFLWITEDALFTPVAQKIPRAFRVLCQKSERKIKYVILLTSQHHDIPLKITFWVFTWLISRSVPSKQETHPLGVVWSLCHHRHPLFSLGGEAHWKGAGVYGGIWEPLCLGVPSLKAQGLGTSPHP